MDELKQDSQLLLYQTPDDTIKIDILSLILQFPPYAILTIGERL